VRISEFQEANRIRNQRFPGTSREWSALEWAGALCGEAGEAANIAKKMRRGIEAESDASLKAALGRELADVVTYAALLAADQGINLEAICREKFNDVSIKRGLPDRI
jgi:NTP pyrophosphatase (non-canonical NTP hydrolase)